jgi:lipoyl(octanoyl) transferase
MNYRDGLQLQQTLLARRRLGGNEWLVLLEHDPVITLGRGARPEHLLCTRAELAAAGIDCQTVSRGGDVTYHGPGQLVGYPIVHLDLVDRDLHRYLRALETALIEALVSFDLPATRHPRYTGVWVAGRKIAAIGVAVRHWISWHGFALNINTDLAAFNRLVPCGLHQVQTTSMEQLLGTQLSLRLVNERIVRSFARVFDLDLVGDYESPLPPQT